MPSDAAYRTAEGGLEYLELHKTRNLRKALVALEPHYRTVAARRSLRMRCHCKPCRATARSPSCSAMRSAASPSMPWRGAAESVRILGPGKIQSLNVAQAAAVLLAALTSPMA